ncbi:MAG TPA: glycosyltransferase [Anaerolineae bacterium]|nr:glycosyltransferase [Anaerolineae bacterium]
MLLSIIFTLIIFTFIILNITLFTNLRQFPRLTTAPTTSNTPFISVLIPARNEAAVITKTITALSHQTYPHYEIILLDDNSTDNTATLARAAAPPNKLTIIPGQPLPSGWLGKNWACHQLSQVAQAPLLLFIDADVTLAPTALAALAHHQTSTNANLLTIWPTQITLTWSERLIIPLINFAILTYLPLYPVHHTHHPSFAAANGQCLLFHRSAYDAIGGHAAVRHQIIEDVVLAQNIKRNKQQLRMALGNQLVNCRMYPHWSAVRDGLAKNILAGHNNSLLFLAASTLFHWTLFIFPWLWLLFAPFTNQLPLNTTPYNLTPHLTLQFSYILAALFILNGILLRYLVAHFSHQRRRDALFLPFSVVLMTIIAAQSAWWHLRGRNQWKGRTIS